MPVVEYEGIRSGEMRRRRVQRAYGGMVRAPVWCAGKRAGLGAQRRLGRDR